MNFKFGKLMFIGVSGLSLTEDEKKFIFKNDIAGVTLFARNLKTPEQILNLCQEIQSLAPSPTNKILIAIDMEGGRVHRLKAPFTQWPAVKYLGDLDSTTVSFQFGQMMGTELLSLGINVDYAPCIDIFTNPLNTVIGDRAFGSDLETVSKHGSAVARGYLKSGIIPCVKHFPGHGNTLLDSHLDLPKENLSLLELEARELIPYQRLFKSHVPMVMTAHILFEKIDPQWPVTCSEVFLKSLLREKLRYNGVIITDDLDMKGLSANYNFDEIPVRSLAAGADLLMYCNQPESPQRALNALEKAFKESKLKIDQLNKSVRRVETIRASIPDIPTKWNLAAETLKSHQEIAESIRKLIPTNAKQQSDPTAVS